MMAEHQQSQAATGSEAADPTLTLSYKTNKVSGKQVLSWPRPATLSLGEPPVSLLIKNAF